MLVAKDHKYPHIILEFKYTGKASANLNTIALSGVNQILEKNYASGLKGKILMMGLAHNKKNTAIAMKL